jgi:hypothetical protein
LAGFNPFSFFHLGAKGKNPSIGHPNIRGETLHHIEPTPDLAGKRYDATCESKNFIAWTTVDGHPTMPRAIHTQRPIKASHYLTLNGHNNCASNNNRKNQNLNYK